ncbi:DUF3996 domain-containing protein [Borrelia duttonii]|uniref:Uncharacterized conserved protein n=1 Tax=Borrelia duttonii (strain Ly) TaxID=412419 RepID=B5RLW4_BORDL|nr:uncharacterized conserved protein [Borrelia duttonii Ly]
MGKNTKKILTLLLIFNLYNLAFSQYDSMYFIECKQKKDGTICTTNDKPIVPEQPKIEPEQPKIEPEQPKIEPKQPEIEPEQPEIEPEIEPEIKPEIKPEKLKPNNTANNNKKYKNAYSFAAGTGTGSPLINLLISVPYVDIDFGYGSFLYFNTINFKPYNLIAIDLIFRQLIGKSLIIGGGFGIGVDWSQANLTSPSSQKPSPYDRIAIVTRLPLSIEYKIIKNLSLGFKIYPTLGPTIFLTEPKIVFEGMRFKFFAIGFIKMFI